MSEQYKINVSPHPAPWCWSVSTGAECFASGHSISESIAHESASAIVQVLEKRCAGNNKPEVEPGDTVVISGRGRCSYTFIAEVVRVGPTDDMDLDDATEIQYRVKGNRYIPASDPDGYCYNFAFFERGSWQDSEF